MRRYVVAILVAVLLVVSGCNETPGPAPSTAPPTSAPPPPAAVLTTQTAQSVLDHLRSVMIKADKRQSRKLAASVLTGGAFERARAYYELRKITGVREKWGAPKVRAQTVVASPSGTFPETALVISRYVSGDRKRQKMRAVYDLVRSTENDRWHLRSRLYLAAKKIEPVIASIDPVSTPIEQSQRTNGIALSQVSNTLATALNHPRGTSARKFTKDPYKAFFRTEVAGWRDKHRRIKATFGGSGQSVAWPTRSGGALAIVPGQWSMSELMLDGWSFHFTKSSGFHRVLRHHYSQAHYDYLTTSLVAIPAEGRLRLIEVSAGRTFLSVQRDYTW